IRN
ncbi:unnamed protein product, partial [Allacma fusca]